MFRSIIDEDFQFPLELEKLGCPESSRKCIITNDRFYSSVTRGGGGGLSEWLHKYNQELYRKYTNIDNFNAIIFHERNLKLSDLPSRRKSQQSYIHFNLESPAYQSGGEELWLCDVRKKMKKIFGDDATGQGGFY